MQIDLTPQQNQNIRKSRLTSFPHVALVCCLLVTAYGLGKKPRFHLVLEIASSKPTTAQLFYDIGRGYNERDSRPAVVSGESLEQFQRIEFRLPQAAISDLRLDPITTTGIVKLRNAAISGPRGIVLTIPLNNLQPQHQIRRLPAGSNEVVFETTSTANDPALKIKLPSEFRYRQVLWQEKARFILLSNSILLGCLAVVFLAKTTLSKLGVAIFSYIKEANAAFQALAQRASTPYFIQFDRYAVWFYVACLLGFCLMSLANLNGSSVGLYSSAYGNGASQSPWLGSPKATRSDEWAYATPDIIHQSLKLNRFDVQNSTRGGHSVALINSVPVKHFTTIFRPQFWGFFVLPVDYAYAIYWQFKGLILLVGVFTWLLLLTKSSFWSICGSLWFFFSPFTQWSYSWSTALPEMIGLICIIMVLFCYLTVGQNKIVLLCTAIALAACAINFALCAYVPHLMPLCWLALFFLMAWCLANRKFIMRPPEAVRRILSVLGVVLLVGIVGTLIYFDVREAIKGIANTTYPGKRIFTGASMPIQIFASHFLAWTTTEEHFPSTLSNISEGSGFLWLAPITLFWVGKLRLPRFQKFALAALWACSAAILAWLLLPIPAEVARILALDRTGGARCLPPLGLANIGIVALCMAASRSDGAPIKERANFKISLLWRTVGIFLPVLTILVLTNTLLISFFKWNEILLGAVLATFFIVAMIEGWKRLLPISLVLCHVLVFGSVNPVMRGLDVFTESAMSNLVQKDRTLLSGKWIVYSDSVVRSGFMAAVGCDTYTGMRFLPDIDHFPLFAANGLDVNIFNNSNYLVARALRPNEKSSFEQVNTAITRWSISPSDPVLKEIGVKYVAFDQKPPNAITSGLIPISTTPVDNLWLFRIP